MVLRYNWLLDAVMKEAQSFTMAMANKSTVDNLNIKLFIGYWAMDLCVK